MNTDAGLERRSEDTAALRAVIDEFARLLATFGGELDAALHEADRECFAVGSAFNGLAAANDGIRSLITAEAQTISLRSYCECIDTALDEAIVGLQFHDRLSQRVGHVSRALHGLARLLGDGIDRSFDEWLALLREVERGHRAEQRRLTATLTASQGSAELF